MDVVPRLISEDEGVTKQTIGKQMREPIDINQHDMFLINRHGFNTISKTRFLYIALAYFYNIDEAEVNTSYFTVEEYAKLIGKNEYYSKKQLSETILYYKTMQIKEGTKLIKLFLKVEMQFNVINITWNPDVLKYFSSFRHLLDTLDGKGLHDGSI